MEEAVLGHKAGSDTGQGAWLVLRTQAGHHSQAVQELAGRLDTEKPGLGAAAEGTGWLLLWLWLLTSPLWRKVKNIK